MNEHKNFIDEQINDNQYIDPNYSIGRVAFGSLVYQPLIESYIKNAYSRNTGSAIYNAINNGGFYSNYTFLGGNTIFGGEGSFLRKIPGIKKLYANSNLDSHKQLFNIKGNTSFNYINPKQNTRNYVTSGGIKNANDMLESGFGFGKKYNFTDKDRFIYNNFYGKNKINSSKNIQEEMSKNIYEKIKSKNYITNNVLNNPKDIEIFNKRVDVFFKSINNKKKINQGKAFLLTRDILSEDELKSIDFSKSNVKEDLINIVKEKSNLINSNSKISLYDLFKDHDSVKSRANIIDKIVGESKELSGKQIEILSEDIFNFHYEDKVIKNIFKKREIQGLKESIIPSLSNDVLDELIVNNVKETAEKISKIGVSGKFSGVIDTLLGNKAGMFLTGALGGPVGIGIQVALGVASAISVAHQEKSINDFVNNSMSNYNNYDFIESEQGITSLGSHYAINQSNYQDYSNIVSNRNISKNSLRDIDPIQIDFKLSDSKNFTIF
jgi:hypothetical protein